MINQEKIKKLINEGVLKNKFGLDDSFIDILEETLENVDQYSENITIIDPDKFQRYRENVLKELTKPKNFDFVRKAFTGDPLFSDYYELRYFVRAFYYNIIQIPPHELMCILLRPLNK